MVNSALTILLTASLASGCGAPSKKASEVAYIFESSTNLESKITELCEAVAGRNAGPTLKGTAFKVEDCGNAGKIAVDLKGTKPIYFQGFQSSSPVANQVVRMTGRGEVWLNYSILGLASSLISTMTKFQNEGVSPGDFIKDIGNTGGAFSGLATPSIKILQNPSIDVNKLEFSAKINFSITGAVKADHDIEIAGKVIDQKIIATIRTLDDRTYEQSLLHRLGAVLMIVPHAGDIYLDFLVDVDVNDPGIGNEAIKGQLQQVLGSGLNTVIDGVRKL